MNPNPTPLPPNGGARLGQLLHRTLVKFGHFMFFARNFLFPVAFILLLLITRPGLPFDSERADWGLDLLGIVIAFSGQACRALAIGQTENIRRGGRQKKVSAKKLITHGVYAQTRNPLYLGNLLIICGLGLIANNFWWYLLMLPLFIVVYVSIILAEEEFLSREFGQHYAHYCLSTPRLVPRFTGLWRSCTMVTFDWQRVLRKEYGVACSWMSMATGLLIWELWARFGYTARAAQINGLILCLGLIAFFYVGTSRMKVTGKLRSS